MAIVFDISGNHPFGLTYVDSNLHKYRWDDLRFPVQGINPPGAVSDPGIDTSDGTFLFDATATEIVAGIAQMPHSWYNETSIKPHIHWSKTTNAAGTVYWQFEYEIKNVGDTFTGTYTTLATAVTVASTPDTATANKHLISSFGEIDMTGHRDSCIIKWRLSRVGASDTYAADAKLYELDFHYRINDMGSVTEYGSV